MDNEELLGKKLNQKLSESKKFIASAIGALCVMLVWGGTLICMFLKTDAAPQFVSLATIVISFLGAITTTILTSQAVFEFKSISAIQTIDTNSKEEKKMELTENITNVNIDITDNVFEEGNGGPELKPFNEWATEEN